MKIVSLFNNKGGVGKTTLAYHLSWALAEMNQKVLMIDMDPQCNLTICGIDQDRLEQIWQEEDPFIDDYASASQSAGEEKMVVINSHHHSIHYLLKPTEDGISDIPNEELPPVIPIAQNLDLIPGRLTISQYESFISNRWAEAYQGQPLSIRTITRIRDIAEAYGLNNGYDYIIIDTSPSLGALNKVIISTVDGFIIPCLPDMFSLYGIRNIGNALRRWQNDFNSMYSLLSDEKRNKFPSSFVHFLGYTIYNAKKYSSRTNPWDLAQAHYNYAQRIPSTITTYIEDNVRQGLSEDQTREPVGGTSVMHSHNTAPNLQQKYHLPMWKLPDCHILDPEDARTIKPNKDVTYYPTQQKYLEFARDFITRANTL